MGKTSYKFIRAGNGPAPAKTTSEPRRAPAKNTVSTAFMKPGQPKYTGGTTRTVKNYGGQIKFPSSTQQ